MWCCGGIPFGKFRYRSVRNADKFPNREIYLDIARRLPDLARATQAKLQGQANLHPIVDQVAALIDQRCALTIRRLTAQKASDSPEEST